MIMENHTSLFMHDKIDLWVDYNARASIDISLKDVQQMSFKRSCKSGERCCNVSVSRQQNFWTCLCCYIALLCRGGLRQFSIYWILPNAHTQCACSATTLPEAWQEEGHVGSWMGQWHGVLHQKENGACWQVEGAVALVIDEGGVALDWLSIKEHANGMSS